MNGQGPRGSASRPSVCAGQTHQPRHGVCAAACEQSRRRASVPSLPVTRCKTRGVTCTWNCSSKAKQNLKIRKSLRLSLRDRKREPVEDLVPETGWGNPDDGAHRPPGRPLRSITGPRPSAAPRSHTLTTVLCDSFVCGPLHSDPPKCPACTFGMSTHFFSVRDSVLGCCFLFLFFQEETWQSGDPSTFER